MLIVCQKCDSSFDVEASMLSPNGRRLECSECGHGWFCGPDGLPAEEPVLPPPLEEADVKEEVSSVVDSLGEEGGEKLLPEEGGEDELLGEEGGVSDALKSIEGEEGGGEEGGSEEEGEGEEEEEGEGEGEGEEDEDLEAKIKEHEKRIKNRRRGRRGESSGIVGWLVLLTLLGGGAWGGYTYRDEIVRYYPPVAGLYQSLGLLQPLGEGLKILPARTETLDNDGQKTLLVVGEIYNTRTDATGVLNVPLLRGALIDANEREVRVWTFRAEEERILPNERIVYRTEIGDPPSNIRALVITFARSGEELR